MDLPPLQRENNLQHAPCRTVLPPSPLLIPVNHFDYHATLLHAFGLDPERLHFEQGQQKRTLLDGQPGRIVENILA